MPLTGEQTIKLENWKAQHNSVLGNISIATKELEGLFARKEIIKEEVKKRESDLLKKQREFENFSERAKAIENRLNTREAHLDEKEKELEQGKASLEKREKDALADIEKKKTKLRQELSSLETDVSEMDEALGVANAAFLEKNSLLLILEERLETGKGEEKVLNKSLSTLIHDLEELDRDYKKNYRVKRETLDDLTTKIEEEKEKIGQPLALLKQREEEIALKERNLKTLIRRFRRYYDEHFPDRELPI